MKKSSKIAITVIFTCLFIISSINFASAQTLYLSDSIDMSRMDSQFVFSRIYPASTGGQSAYTQETIGNGKTLSQINFVLYNKFGTITGSQISCEVYLSDEGGTSGTPTGSVLAQALNTVSLDSWANGTPFYFYFNNTLVLTSNTHYAIVLKSIAGNLDDTHYLRCSKIVTLTGTEATNHNGGYWQNAQWYMSAGESACFYVFTQDIEATPTPAPTPSPTPTDDYKWDENTNSWSWWNGTDWIPSSGPSPTANAQIVTFTGNMITYIVPLALLLLPAVVGAWALGRAGAAKWGFIAGLNIGAIMCYLYLPSFGLWAVIAIVMIDVLMIFASTRGGD